MKVEIIRDWIFAIERNMLIFVAVVVGMDANWIGEIIFQIQTEQVNKCARVCAAASIIQCCEVKYISYA